MRSLVRANVGTLSDAGSVPRCVDASDFFTTPHTEPAAPDSVTPVSPRVRTAESGAGDLVVTVRAMTVADGE